MKSNWKFIIKMMGYELVRKLFMNALQFHKRPYDKPHII